ncbi:molybdenum cofactor cytidylyltransferase [Pedobacter sp. UYEF25]
MISSAKIGVVILAAGSSSRLGYAKQLVELNGKFLLQNVIDVAEELNVEPRVLVLGARANEIAGNINFRNFEVLINRNWEEGMSSSIKLGLESAQKMQTNLAHLLILLSDQPLVSKINLENLISTHLAHDNQATFSEYAGDIGVPAIFSSIVFPYLKKLKGDHGAKKLIEQEMLNFGTVKFDGGKFDVDTEKDVATLKQFEIKNES